MSYIEGSLLSSEKIIKQAELHWIVFLKFVVFVLMAYFFSTMTLESGDAFELLTFAMAIIALIQLIVSIVELKTTELAVTSKRTVAKTGLISRNTIELNNGKVESIVVNQSILGRILNYGTIVIQGTGGGSNPIKNIKSPMVFKRVAMEEIDKSINSN